jgi:phytol kinase
VIPVLTLTVADSVGALIGGRYGMARYRTDEGLKSAEGSLAFFTAAFLSCHIPLLLFSDTGRAETLLISLTAGFLVMLMEAISWRGQDNLIIPVGMFILLQIYLPMTAQALFVRLLVMVALVFFVLLWRKRTTLSDSAVLAGALSGYALWALGGLFWLLPPLVLFLVYVRLPAFPSDARPVQNLHAVTRVMAGGFFWLILHEISEDRQYLIPFFLCMAAHTGNIITARLRVVKPDFSAQRIVLTAVSVPVVLFAMLALAGVFADAWSAVTLLWLPVSVLISVCLFYPTWPVEHLPSQKLRIWASETLIAVLASLPGLIPLLAL